MDKEQRYNEIRNYLDNMTPGYSRKVDYKKVNQNNKDKDMKKKIIKVIYALVYLFAFSSSVYCLSLILKHFLNSNSDFLSLSFFICIFIIGILINYSKDNKD